MTITYTVGNKLYLNITNKCPCSCSFCIRQNGDGAYGSDSLWLEHEPDYSEVEKALDLLDLSQFEQIVFCGYGEPLERLELVIDICKYLRKRNSPPIRINTNGLADLINKVPTARRLEGLADVVSISMNAPDAEAYCRICSPAFGNESFDAMLKFAEDCKKYINKVKFSVVDVISADEFEKCQEIADSMDIELRIRKFEE